MTNSPSHPIRIGRGGAGNIFRTPPTPPSSYPPSGPASSTSTKHIHPQIVDVKTERRNSAPLGNLPSGRRASTGRGGAGNFRKDGVVMREVVEEEAPHALVPPKSSSCSTERQRRGSRGGAGNLVRVDEGKVRSSSIAMWELEGDGRRWSIVSSPNNSKERRHTHHGPRKEKEEEHNKEERRKSRKGSMAGFWEYLKHGKNRPTSTSVPSPPESPEPIPQNDTHQPKSKPEKRRTFSEPGEAARLFSGYSFQTNSATSPAGPGILRGALSGVGYGELAPNEQLPTVLEEGGPVSELVEDSERGEGRPGHGRRTRVSFKIAKPAVAGGGV
ncbi:hypothetical protein YB2330_005060 [Saitoella coloradoensis]